MERQNREESLESAFSGLNISSDVRFRSQPASSSSDGRPLSVVPAQFTNNFLPGRIDVGSSTYLPHAGDDLNQLLNDDLNQLLNDDLNQLVNYNEFPDFPSYNSPVSPSFYWNKRGGILWLAKDEVLSGMLSLSLRRLSSKEIDMILWELEGCWGNLVRDQFGSRFFQRLLEVCNEGQKATIIVDLVDHPYNLLLLCLHPFGSRAIQKLLETLKRPEEISCVIGSLTAGHGALVLATDPYGQNVLKYCVVRFPGEYTQNLVYEIADNCYTIATSKSGCCVVKTCVDHSRGAARKQLISEIIVHAVHLSEDRYGNYVVQHLIGLKIEQVAECLLKQFEGYFASLSCDKYGSNVVEKMLKLGGNVSTAILVELLRSPHAKMLLLDPFGNFVIQSALSVSRGKMFNVLLNFIKANEVSMQSNLYGQKILCWLRRRKLHSA